MDYRQAALDVYRVYSEDRLARSRARLLTAWTGVGRPDRIPLVYTGLPVADGAPSFDIWEATCSDEESLAAQFAMIMDRAQLDDDYVPSLYPGCRQGTLPTAYGAEEVWSGDHTWVRPILRDAQDIYELPRPDFSRDGVAAEMLERIRFFRAATAGQMPIQLLDMQGPLDLASNLWGTEPLLLAMYENPAAVHELLQRMTDDFIAYVRLVREAAEWDLVPIHCMPSVWMPAGLGMALSEDLLAVVSPRLYREFGRPYNEQIARAFGGVVIHSCGSVEHNLAFLADTEGLVGVNLGASETSLPCVVEAIQGRCAILSHHGVATCNSLPRLTPEEHIRLCVQLFREKGARGIILVTPVELSRDEALELSPVAAKLAWIADRQDRDRPRLKLY
jgi:hypothetical protein